MVKTIEYERYQFKLIKQETEETFDSFVCRLYTQSRKCDFNDIDSQMKDQIIEKCQSDSLRREAFRNTMTLDQLILKGRTIETKNKSLEMHRKKILQQESVEKKSGKNINERNDQPNINSHQNEDRQNSNHRSGERPTSYNIEVAVQSRQNYVPKRHSEECNRCGFDDHFYTSSKCPARGEQCGYCGKFGHYSRMCFDMAFVNKRPHRDESTNRPSKFPRYSAETRSSSQDNKFASKSSLESDNKKTRDNEWPKIENTRKKNSDPLHSNVVADSLKSSNSEAHIENKNATLEFKTNESVGKIRIKSVQSLLSPPRLEKQKVECKQTVNSSAPLQEISKIVKSRQEVSSPSRSPSVMIIEKTFDCLVGGKAVKLIINKNAPFNMISNSLYKKLTEENIKTCTTDMFPMRCGNYRFYGHFTSKIEINNRVQYINFSLKNGSEDYVTINKKMAYDLGLF